jgi:hypothetical protein
MTYVADPAACLPGLSTTLGIGLTAGSVPPSGVQVRYRWHADRGYLKTFSEVTHETENFGTDAVTAGGKLYWSCDGVGDRSPLAITIVTEKASNGEELARVVVRLEWDGETMRVAR